VAEEPALSRGREGERRGLIGGLGQAGTWQEEVKRAEGEQNLSKRGVIYLNSA